MISCAMTLRFRASDKVWLGLLIARSTPDPPVSSCFPPGYLSLTTLQPAETSAHPYSLSRAMAVGTFGNKPAKNQSTDKLSERAKSKIISASIVNSLPPVRFSEPRAGSALARASSLISWMLICSQCWNVMPACVSEIFSSAWLIQPWILLAGNPSRMMTRKRIG